MQMTTPTEEELIGLVIDHYATAIGRPAPLKMLKTTYGPRFNFEALGYGKFSQWMQRHEDRFSTVKLHNSLVVAASVVTVTEEELLDDVKLYLSRCKNIAQRKRVLQWLRAQYGDVEFSSFGYGPFSSFLQRHGINIAKMDG